MATKAPWQSKIVGHGRIPVSQVLFNENNWRIHPKAQQDALAGIVAEIGFIRSITINKRTSPEWPDGARFVETLVDGHDRSAQAMRYNGDDYEIDVEYVDLTPREEAEALLTLDPL